MVLVPAFIINSPNQPRPRAGPYLFIAMSSKKKATETYEVTYNRLLVGGWCPVTAQVQATSPTAAKLAMRKQIGPDKSVKIISARLLEPAPVTELPAETYQEAPDWPATLQEFDPEQAQTELGDCDTYADFEAWAARWPDASLFRKKDGAAVVGWAKYYQPTSKRDIIEFDLAGQKRSYPFVSVVGRYFEVK